MAKGWARENRVMTEVLTEDVLEILSLASPDPEAPLPEMASHGEERDFPTIGPASGRTLRILAKLVGARRIFEFGSGFGYSAAWFLGALPDDGEIVLTDYDSENLAEAETFLDRLPGATTVHYEAGDAMETVTRYEGPFDVVLIDHDKTDYVAGLERVRPKVRPGGVIVADNVLTGPTSPGEVRAALEGAPAEGATKGIAQYLRHVRDETTLSSTLLPLGSGLLVSRTPGRSD
jgi:caffeoyl-CoA O-methyltransferase